MEEGGLRRVRLVERGRRVVVGWGRRLKRGERGFGGRVRDVVVRVWWRAERRGRWMGFMVARDGLV